MFVFISDCWKKQLWSWIRHVYILNYPLDFHSLKYEKDSQALKTNIVWPAKKKLNLPNIDSWSHCNHSNVWNKAITPVNCRSPLGPSWRGGGPTRSPCAKSRWPGHISRVFASPSTACVWTGSRGTNYPPSSPRSSPGCVWELTGTPRFPLCGICWSSRPAGWKSARARRRKTPGDWRQSGPVCGMTS